MSDINKGRKPFSSIHYASRMRLVRQSRGPCSPLEANTFPAAEGEKPGAPGDPCTRAESISLQASADDSQPGDNDERPAGIDGQSGGNGGVRKVVDGRRWLNRAAAVAAELVCVPQTGAAQQGAAASAAGRRSPQAEEPEKAGRDKKSG